ncbi:oligosaccharide flippase family protein [Demequina sediminis]|nr:oligosaccharide flippase family protein [Demequina sediminis]
MLAGLLAARLLTIDAYARYALAIAVVTAVTVVGDSGLGSQVVAIAGRYMPDTSRISGIYGLARSYRTWISATLSVVSAPILVTLLLRNQASVAEASAIAALVIATVFLSLNGSLVRSVLQLDYQFRSIQISGLAAAMVRLAGSALLVPLAVLGALLPTLANAVAAGVQWIWMRKTVVERFDLGSGSISADDRTEMRRALRRLLPLNVVLVAQSQGASLLLGALGATSALASVTAISRYGLLFAFVSTVAVSVLAPALARTNSGHRAVVRRYALVVGAISLTTMAMLGLIWALRDPLLALLGTQYTGLSREFLIVSVGSAVAATAAGISGMNLARGWTGGSWMMAPTTAIWFAWGFTMLDLHSTTGAAVLMATSALPSLATAVAQAAFGLKRPTRIAASDPQ